MIKSSDQLDSPAAQIFSQIFVIFLSCLITSGAGLLSYVGQSEGPMWLRTIVVISAVVVGLSFVGWVLCNFMAYAKDHAQDQIQSK